MADSVQTIRSEESLSDFLSKSKNDGRVVRTRLQANDRVIARVTDGIYRQPASALRELISNAWDADATRVTILTDAPRFSRIYVRDNGNGMSNVALARLLKNIGGSAKRREEGKDVGVTNKDDPDRTPGGRPLIGKIGIGLFSVSQLARRFQIITKVKGTNYRLLAEVELRAYSDNPEDDPGTEAEDEFISGQVHIRREHDEKLNAHGTDIILSDLKPPVRELLRDSDRWRAVAEREADRKSGDEEYFASRVEPPSYHSGFISDLHKSAGGPDLIDVAPKLPWKADDPANVRMAKLVDAVASESDNRDRPDLETTLDAYLEMIWTLGLSAPVEYVDTHPFDLKNTGRLKLFWIAQERGKGNEVQLKRGQTVREAIRLNAPGNPELEGGKTNGSAFKVIIDGVELRRPIRFKVFKTDKRSLENAYMFVGKFEPNLSKVSKEQRGGDLSLEAYLYWTGKVVPKENNGVLVRIRGASGALFDSTFFEYQVSELTRLKQITSELFVHSGLDAALNIDRESFNFAHPHIVLVTRWFHSAIKQLTNRLKDDSAKSRGERRDKETTAGKSKLSQHAAREWRNRQGSEELPDVAIVSSEAEAKTARQQGSIPVIRERMPIPPKASANEIATREAQVAALVQVLAAYGVLEDRPYREQQELVGAILQIFQSAEK